MSDESDREELAVERTHFAEDRTIMAMERTCAGWMRTAFAAIGIGLAFHVVFGAFDPPWLAKAIATLFIFSGAWLAIAAERRARRAFDRLHPHQLGRTPTPIFKWLGWAAAGGALVLVAGLWVLNDGGVATA